MKISEDKIRKLRKNNRENIFKKLINLLRQKQTEQTS